MGPKAIFLTGATGFLGGHLLDELLAATSADIYCLIRDHDSETGRVTLKKGRETRPLFPNEKSHRVIPISGDLSEPLFGLAEKKFNDLADNIDAVYHNGAHINTIYSYPRLKAANVNGTREILKLAGRGEKKSVHFISTVAVFYGQNRSYVSEDDRPKIAEDLKWGYRRTKQVGEKMMIDARKEGIPASIYRISRIMGHSETGVIHNLNDFLCSMIKGCIVLGTYPDIDIRLNLTPVDYVAGAIRYLANKKDLRNNTFHIVNPRAISWNEWFDTIRSLGYTLKKVSYKKWIEELLNQRNHPENKFFMLLRLLLNSPKSLFSEDLLFDNRRVMEALAGSSISCPPMDKKIVSAYLSYFKKIGYINASQRRCFD